MKRRADSASRRSCSAVEPIRSAKTIVTTLRASAPCGRAPVAARRPLRAAGAPVACAALVAELRGGRELDAAARAAQREGRPALHAELRALGVRRGRRRRSSWRRSGRDPNPYSVRPPSDASRIGSRWRRGLPALARRGRRAGAERQRIRTTSGRPSKSRVAGHEGRAVAERRRVDDGVGHREPVGEREIRGLDREALVERDDCARCMAATASIARSSERSRRTTL